MKIIKTENWKTTKWSGGTTSEIFIYPENALFKKGNYEVRISIATVEHEYSEFTPLPGVERTLMVLEGSQKLTHRGPHTSELKQFNQDKFHGNWDTSSEGISINFNVIYQDDQFVRVQSIPLIKGMKGTLDFSDTFVFVYLKEGILRIGEHEINAGMSAVIKETIQIEAIKDVILIEVVF